MSTISLAAQQVLSAEDVVAALRKRFPPNEYAFFQQVRDQTWARRTADVIVMGLWPSRGQYVHGIEVKVSRQDWLRELRAPEKAETFARYCDFWSIAVPDRAPIVPLDELPPDWGLIVCGKKVHIAKAASKQKPQPLSRKFVAELLRCAQRQMSNEAELNEQYKKGLQAGEERVRHTRERLERLEQRIRKFEEASGVQLSNPYGDPQQIGAAVRVVLRGESGIEQHRRSLTRLQAEAERIAAAIAAELEQSPAG